MRWLPLEPPRVPVDADLAWVLQRAFAPHEQQARPGARSVALADALELGARIIWRSSLARVETEVGSDVARRWVLQLLQRRAANRVLDEAMATAAGTAAQLGVDLVWIKYAALRARGVVEEGQREARDIDALLREAEAERLHVALERAGFRSVVSAVSGALSPLVNAAGACIELHTRVPGLRADAFFSEACAARAGGCVPSPQLLAAHVLAHGLIQHLTSPDIYSPFRVICDAIDLRLWELSGNALIGHAPELDSSTVSGMSLLSQVLANGGDPRQLARDSDARRLLDHMIAATCQPAYQEALAAHRIRELAKRGELLPGFKRLLLGRCGATDVGREWTGTTALERLKKAGRLARGSLLLARQALRRR